MERCSTCSSVPECNLSPKQFELLELLSLGLSNKTTAEKLFLSEGTIKQQLNSVFKILEVDNRAQAVQYINRLTEKVSQRPFDANNLFKKPSFVCCNLFDGTKQCKLTPRQYDVLSFLSQGLKNKEIAAELSVSESTVKKHIHAIFKILKVNNRLQAIRCINCPKLILDT